MSIQIKVDIGGIENLRAKLMYLPDGMREQVYQTLNVITDEIVTNAKTFCPVRTGRLRASIYGSATRDLIVKVGAFAPYARFVEFGTRYMAPRPFLTTAFFMMLPKVGMLMTQALRLAIQEMRAMGR